MTQPSSPYPSMLPGPSGKRLTADESATVQFALDHPKTLLASQPGTDLTLEIIVILAALKELGRAQPTLLITRSEKRLA